MVFKLLFKIMTKKIEDIILAGSECINKKEFDKAEVVFQEGLEISPSSAACYNNLGMIKLLKKALKIHQNNPRLLNQTRLVFLSCGIISIGIGIAGPHPSARRYIRLTIGWHRLPTPSS